MLKVRTLLLAEDVVRDTASNTVTIVKLLEQVLAESYPLTIPKTTLYALFDKDETDSAEQQIQVEFTFNGELKNAAIFHLPFYQSGSSRITIDLGLLRIVEFGHANFTVRSLDGKELGTYSIDFALRETSVATATR